MAVIKKYDVFGGACRADGINRHGISYAAANVNAASRRRRQVAAADPAPNARTRLYVAAASKVMVAGVSKSARLNPAEFACPAHFPPSGCE